MILLTGATGNNGAEIARQLIAAGARVRAMAVHPDQGRAQAPPGVEIVPGDLDRPETFAPALAGGVEKVLLLSPADARLAARETAFAAAAREAGVRHLVKFSVTHAADEPAVGFGRWHGPVERTIVNSGLVHTFLRPTVFMQNLLWFADSIKQDGVFSLPLGSARVAVVDTRDVAAVAARVLTDPGDRHANRAYELTGPAALTYAEAAATLSAVLGKRVRYAPITLEEHRRRLLVQGMPAAYADAEIELDAALTGGLSATVSPEVARLTGRPPRTFEDFARDHAGVFA